jgi:hypothetical protein
MAKNDKDKKVEETIKHKDYGLNMLSHVSRGMVQNLPEKTLDSISGKMQQIEERWENLATKKNQDKTTNNNHLDKIFTDSAKSGIESIDGELRDIYMQNKSFYTILRDYEMMPILIPQLVRVLNFLVNEVVSPDINSDNSFIIKFRGAADEDVKEEIERIRQDHDLDRNLYDVYRDRFKVGRLIYLVQNYKDTFSALSVIMNESSVYGPDTLLKDIDLKEEIEVEKLNEAMIIPIKDLEKNKVTNINMNLSELNISIDWDAPLSDLNENIKIMNAMFMESGIHKYKYRAHNENVSNVKLRDIVGASQLMSGEILNENAMDGFSEEDKANMKKIVAKINKNDDIRRASVKKLDAARVFPLKASGRTIGYFYYLDTGDKTTNSTKLQEIIKQKLTNSRMAKASIEDIENQVAVKTAKAIFKTAGAKFNIDSFEDLDLLHNFIESNGILDGDKKFKFYYAEDIFDLSRREGSLLTNSVYFAKLFTSLMHNNIITKISKGRNREIYTVKAGVSPDVQQYINQAIDNLLNSADSAININRPFERILNPLTTSTHIIPADDNADPFIVTDIINGQDVDMDNEIIKFLLNSIISSYGVDPAVLDLVNNNIDFAKSLSMLNREMVTLNKNEQNDLQAPWEKMVLAILYAEGSNQLREQIEAGSLEVKFYRPKALMLELTQNEVNNARSFAEALIDLHPVLNGIKDGDLAKSIAVYEIVKDQVSADLDKYESIIEEAMTRLKAKAMVSIKVQDSIADTEVTSQESGEGETEEDFVTDDDDN